MPTNPAVHDPTATAVPASSLTSDAAPETAPATAVPSPRPTSAPPVQHTDANDPHASAGDPSKKTSQAAAGDPHNIWRLPPPSVDVPTTTDALSVLQSALYSRIQESAAAHDGVGSGGSGDSEQDAGTQGSAASGDRTGPDGSGGTEQHTGAQASAASGDQTGSNGLGNAEQQAGSHDGNSQQSGHDGSDDVSRQEYQGRPKGPTDPSSHVADAPGNADQAAAVWAHDGQTFTAVSNDGSFFIQGGGVNTTLAAGTVETFAGQEIIVPSAANVAVVDGAVATLKPINKVADSEGPNAHPAAVFTEPGHTFTAAVEGKSLVLEGAGTITTMAYGAEGTIAEQSVSIPSSPERSVINVNGQAVTLQSGGASDDSEVAALQTAAVLTQGGETFTAMMQGESTVVLEAASTTLSMSAGSALTLGDDVFSVPTAGGVLVHDGTTVTFEFNALSTQPSEAMALLTYDGQTFTAKMQGDSTIVLEAARTTVSILAGWAVTLGDDVFSIPTSGGVLFHDGTTVTFEPTAISTEPAETVALLTHDGQTLSAADIGSSVIIIAGGSTITLTDGAQTRLGDETISAASTGGAVIVNGTPTLVMSASTNAADFSVSSGSEGEGTAAATTETQSAASSSQFPAWISVLVAVGSCVLVKWI